MPPSPATSPVPDVAEHVLATAGRLFARHGFAAVGVGPIVKASGIGKATLYKHYPAKTDLIVAWLKREDAAFFARAAEWEAAAEAAPAEQLRGFFRGLAAWVGSPECLGCPFHLAVAEFPDEDAAPHRVATTHKAALLFRFRRLCRAAALPDPESTAQQFLLITDGALLAARMFPGRNPGRDVARAAEALLTVR